MTLWKDAFHFENRCRMIYDMECLSDGKKFVKKSIPYQSADVFKSKTELSLSCRIGKAF